MKTGNPFGNRTSSAHSAFQRGRLRLSGAGYAEQRYFWLSILLVGSWYLYLNFCIPFYADDYTYSMVFGTSRHLESLMDVIVSMRVHYQTWGGRIVAQGIEQLALLGEWQTAVFRVLNTCVFLGVNLLFVDFARGKLSSGSTPGSNAFDAAAKSSNLDNEIGQPIWMLFLISFYLFWLFVRTLGETTLWLTGSVVYLWTLFFVLLFLKLSIVLYTRNSFPILILHVLVGFFAGLGYETTSFTAFIMLLILFFRQRRGFRRAVWQIPGFLAYLVGYILLIAAPGNIARAEHIGRDGSFLSMIIENTLRYVKLHLYSWEILLLLLILVLVSFRKVGRIDWITWLFIGAGFFNNGLMLASPTLPLRSNFPSSAFFICAIISLLSNPKLVTKRILGWILITFSIVSVILAVSDGISYWKLRVLDKERKSIARTALENGESTMEWPLPRMRFNQRVFERDIKGGSSYWVNERVARYYGFDAVFGKEPGLEYYGESEPWLTADSDFGDVRLIDISKYCDEKRCYLYFRFSANKDLDVDWDKLFFRFRYTYPGALYLKVIELIPDKFSRDFWPKADFITRPHRVGENYIFIRAIPKGHSAINKIEFSIESKPGIYRWPEEET